MRMAGAIGVGQLVGRGALALALLLLVRHLTPEQFATLALALAILTILATFADAGFARLLLRDTARGGESASRIVHELLRVRLVAVGAAGVLAVPILLLGPGGFDPGFVPFAVSYLVMESIAFGYENAAVGAERPMRFVLAQCIAAIAMLSGLGLLILSDGVTLTTAMAVLAGASALKVCGHRLAWRGSRAPSSAEDPPHAPRDLFRQALPFLGLAVLAAVYYRVGLIALYSLRGPSETASYAAASRVLDVTALFAGIAFLAVSPALSRMHRDNPQQVWPHWRRMVKITAFGAIPGIALVALAAEPICAVLFGETYRVDAAADLRLMLPGAALMMIQAISAAVVFMSDEHRDVLRLTAVNVVAAIALAFGLSAAMGSQGAALALTLAEAVTVTTFGVLIARRHGLQRGGRNRCGAVVTSSAAAVQTGVRRLQGDQCRPLQIVVDMRIVDRPGMERTGVGRYAIEATRAMCRVRPGWHFSLLSNRELVLEPNAVLCRTRWPTHRSWARVGWLHAGARLELAPGAFDCWVATAFTTPLWWRGRSVVTIHDLMFVEQREAYSGRINALYATAITRRSARAAGAIVCGSRETRARLAHHWSIDCDKVAVAPYGVSEVFFARSGSQQADHPTFVLYVGTFEARKGLDTLHAAMRRVNAGRATPVELMLAGRPGWGADGTVSRLRADPAVTLRIDPSDEELAHLYRTATVLAYPSRAEGFGLPVAEAMASGCAVVSSDLSCVREFAGDAPLYAPIGDDRAFAAALTRLLEDDQDRLRRESVGKANADGLSWTSVGERLADSVEAVTM